MRNFQGLNILICFMIHPSFANAPYEYLTIQIPVYLCQFELSKSHFSLAVWVSANSRGDLGRLRLSRYHFRCREEDVGTVKKHRSRFIYLHTIVLPIRMR